MNKQLLILRLALTASVVGAQTPGFTLTNLTGEPVPLSGMTNKSTASYQTPDELLP
ncbi:MAG: hypothetical protein LBD91_02730 [Prevotellaceae bacterium]|jgi:hypothetical protein|nr:hypothetical protein [Prevotellaceae bacterium]